MKTETNAANTIETNDANAMDEIDTNVQRVEAAIAAKVNAERRRAQRAKSAGPKPSRKRGTKPLNDSTIQITFRIPAAWVERADNIGRKLSRPGIPINRSDAFRAGLALGLVALEKETRR